MFLYIDGTCFVPCLVFLSKNCLNEKKNKNIIEKLKLSICSFTLPATFAKWNNPIDRLVSVSDEKQTRESLCRH